MAAHPGGRRTHRQGPCAGVVRVRGGWSRGGGGRTVARATILLACFCAALAFWLVLVLTITLRLAVKQNADEVNAIVDICIDWW